LQVERLQLELQLAQLKLQDSQPHQEKADKQPGEKSLGDLKAPHNISPRKNGLTLLHQVSLSYFMISQFLIFLRLCRHIKKLPGSPTESSSPRTFLQSGGFGGLLQMANGSGLSLQSSA